MSVAGNMVILTNPITLVLDDGSAFPATVRKGVGAVAYNTDAINELILDFTLENNNVLTITVPAGIGWYDVLPQFKSVDLNAGNLSTGFQLHIKEYADVVTAGGGLI